MFVKLFCYEMNGKYLYLFIIYVCKLLNNKFLVYLKVFFSLLFWLNGLDVISKLYVWVLIYDFLILIIFKFIGWF